MPTPKAAMYAALIGNQAVTAVVGQQVYPDQAAEDVVEPYLVYQVVSDFQRKGLRGPVGTRRLRFQLTAFCATRLQAQTVHSALRAFFDGVSNQTFGGLLVAGSFVGTGEDDEGAVDSDEPPRPGEEAGLREVRMDVLWLIP